ncbi:MAG: hypothetical protein Q7R41_04865 [Phycisphaerales bacterium]|nr:hypothetical protein [Phycisphaerales bacterium]
MDDTDEAIWKIYDRTSPDYINARNAVKIRDGRLKAGATPKATLREREEITLTAETAETAEKNL